MVADRWAVAGAYEDYVGRWSRLVARDFVPALAVPAGRDWLDVGCGTGALSAAVLRLAGPAAVIGVDPSEGFLRAAREQVGDPRVTFQPADARDLPFPAARFDAVVSALALNFVPDPARAAAEFARVARPGAVVAAYVWDYAGGMTMMRAFWAAAAEIDPAAADQDEGRRFPLCRPEPLAALWIGAGLRDAAVRAIEVPTVFRDFDDYWRPFLGGTGSAPTYLATLGDEQRDAIRERLRSALDTGADEPISLTARAWAVSGLAPTPAAGH